MSLSDSTKPTHFRFDASGSDSIQGLCLVRYDKSDTSGEYNYQEVYWKEPMDFISGMQYNNDNSVIVEDVNGSTKLAILNDKMPSYYTTFDNEHIVMDSYDATVDTTLQASKTQAFITKIPTFTISDSFVPDLSDTLKPLLLAEAKSVCFSIFKQGVDPKIDQSARRLKSYTQNDKHKVVKPNTRNKYGR